MHSIFALKNHFKEEHDFFLSYINDKLKEIDIKLAAIDLQEIKSFSDPLDQFSKLNNKIALLNDRREFENMKDHYYLALNHGKSKGSHSFQQKKNKKQEKDLISEEQKYKLEPNNPNVFNKSQKNEKSNYFHQMSLAEGEGESFSRPLVISLLNLIHVAKSLKSLKNQDEFLNFLENKGMKPEELNEISIFYKSCFSKSANKNFATTQSKLLFCSNMLEIYCNEHHPLHNHFQTMRQKIEIIAISPIFLNSNLISNSILQKSQNLNKSDLHNLSGSQSDDTRRVIKNNFHRNKANLENYDGDSEKSIHKSEREEVKEENEEEFIENKAKSDGENSKNDESLNLEQFSNKPKYKTIVSKKIQNNKFKKNKKVKKIFDDSGDHATGSASDRNYEDSKTKLFSWGIRGIQKNNSNPPKGFDTDKDMKL